MFEKKKHITKANSESMNALSTGLPLRKTSENDHMGECFQEPSRRDGSFEYPQHIFWLTNKKIIFLLHALN